MPNLAHSSETESIVGIQFGVFSPDEIVRRSVVEVTTWATQEGKIGGLADPRMGVLENGKLCRSCGQNNHGCPGHFGHYKLARPVYYIQFYKMILKILRCTCIKCAKLLINKDRAKHLRRSKGENRWKAVLTACQEVTRCGEQTEDGCGARQPHRYHDEDICRIVAEWKDIATEAGAPGTLRRFLEPEYVYRLLRRISDEDVDFMGFSRLWCRPDWMMCSVIAIPPPQVRPSVLQDNNQRSEDDLTQKLIDIIKTNATLGDKIAAGAKKKAIDEWTLLLQYHVATLVDNDIPGVAQSAQRSGRPLKSLQQRLGTKEGRIRNNLQGKRVEFSARSVITPDPNISVEELGVPLKVAMNLTFPERATSYNIDRLYALVQNGPDTYPGAKSIQRATTGNGSDAGSGGRMISLKHVNTKSIQLFEGDVVNRHLLDGDPVLFNRQPSLHRMSMMCHRVRVLPYSTFRLNVSVTKPYNADFDGDEMNMHCPQSVEAATELREIAAVSKQMISPRLSKPLISVVQDTLVGVNRLTRPTEFFSRREFMNLLVHSKRWDGRMPPPAKTDPIPLWSGQQVVSCLLPAVHLAMANKMWDKAKGKGDPNYVVINNGQLEQGILDGDVFDKALIHILYNDFSPEMTVDFIDSLQAVVATYLQNSGFSVGLSDIIADADTLSSITAESEDLKKKLESLQLQVHMGLFDNTSGRSNQEEFEGKVFQTLDKAVGAAGKLGLKSLAANNRMVNMVKCGSKGSDINIAQMISLLGQQSIEGKRIGYGFQDRTLPHFKRYDDGADARGYIESSFVKGLNPAEFFFHAMTGREGLIDTAVKSVTADTLIVILEAGQAKTVRIGDWIDAHLAARVTEVEYFPNEADLEMLQLNAATYIPSVAPDGRVTWGKVAAVTRHNPGNQLYRVETRGGRSVIVTASKSLLIWNPVTKLLEQRNTPDVRIGECMPVTSTLPEPPFRLTEPSSASTLETILLDGLFAQADEIKRMIDTYEPVPAEYQYLINMLKARLSICPAGAKTQNDVVLDEITAIEPVSPDMYPKMYDLTVPETFTFGLANGLQVYDTADSGYMQRQLVKTMEDLVTYHDGSVRDAGGVVIQLAYGDDGTSATKIENQPIGLGNMTDAEIRGRFTVDDAAAARSQSFIEAVLRDRDMLVRNVWGGRVENSVQSAVHLPRLIANAIQQLGLEAKGELVTGAHILDTIDRIIQRTRPDNRLWAALLRYHLNPRDLRSAGFTRTAFDWLAEQIVIKHMRSWAVPGEMSGIIAAQSLGEPTTQMTLNSVDWSTEILISKNGKILAPKIGEFIDDYIENCDEERIQRLPNDQLYVALDDGHDWRAISCDENGRMQWTKLEAITKHPVINEDGTDTILEVTLESGRTVKATKARSFLKYAGNKIIQLNGTDLKVGDLIPLTNHLHIDQVGLVTKLELVSVLSSKEWLFGTEVAKALAVMTAADAAGTQSRHWFAKANGVTFTVPYARSDSFRDAYTNGKNMYAANIKAGFVYPKKLWDKISQIPDTIALDREFGFFCGAYISEGSTSPTQIQITNNDDAFLAPIRTLLDKWEIGHHTVSVDRDIAKTGIKRHTTSLIIHSTLLTTVMKSLFGAISDEKTLPDWALQAPDEFVRGLMDSYISGDGCVATDGSVCASSVSQSLMIRLSALLSRYEIFGTHSSSMPAQKNFDSVSRQYAYRILPKYAETFAQHFTLTVAHKQDRLNDIKGRVKPRTCQRAAFNETILDRVKNIVEVAPLNGRVYDLTVASTRNFSCLNGIGCADTFHLSGVAAKSGMTRGVPRLKELLKATQNPKATSLTIALRPDIRNSKENARRLAQELEFTMLKDLVLTSRIYYDPRDSASLIADDAEWLSFFAAFEQEEEADDAIRNPWIIRLELDREKMFTKNITMEDINYVLQKCATPISLSYTDHNATRMILRVRLPQAEGKAEGSGPLDDLTLVKKMQNNILMGTLVRGLPGLRSVSFRKLTGSDEIFERNTAADGKYEPVEQFVLDTFGTNFIDVIIHPDVDGTRLISNHVHDIYETLGIEAARQTLFKEIFTLFEQAAPVNYRHVSLLVDTQCNRGRMMSADRIGVNRKQKIGPLAKASFEQTEDIMLRAAMFGEMDAVTGVAANIMTGQPIRGGTSFTQVLLDETAFQEFMTTAPPPRKSLERAPALVQAEIDKLLDTKQAPGCRQEDLRIPAALPPVDPTVQVGAELPDLDIVFIDENE